MTSDDAHTPDGEESDLRAATRAFQRARSSQGVVRGSILRKLTGTNIEGALEAIRCTSREIWRSTLMSTALAEFLSHQGWEDDAARAGLFEQWPEIVGEDVAEHVHVESWNDGQLVLRADSTAWATQVRLLTASLLERVRAALGPDVVESVQVKGPRRPRGARAPGWSKVVAPATPTGKPGPSGRHPEWHDAGLQHSPTV